MLDGCSNFPAKVGDITNKRYLDAFAYGARVVHARPDNPQVVADYRTLQKLNEPQMVQLGYHSILRSLLGIIGMVVPVVRQNYIHWTEGLGWQRPTDLPDPFGVPA